MSKFIPVVDHVKTMIDRYVTRTLAWKTRIEMPIPAPMIQNGYRHWNVWILVHVHNTRNKYAVIGSCNAKLCLTFQESFGHVEKWLDRLYRLADMPQTVIVGNKCDLEKAVDDEVSNIIQWSNLLHSDLPWQVEYRECNDRKLCMGDCITDCKRQVDKCVIFSIHTKVENQCR